MPWGNPTSFSEQLLANILKPFVAVYGVGSYLRLYAYDHGYLSRHKLSVPVVSIGNLTCGGTGKTTITIDLAKRLLQMGRNVAIVSRGYCRKSSEKLLIVSDGQGRIANCADSGDEPYMMAQAVPQAKVIVSNKRFIAAAVAVNVYNADVILLDDGFQHLSIERDLDLVLIDYTDDLAHDLLLPAGRLREPISALKRATNVVITKVPHNFDQAKLTYLEEVVRKYNPQVNLTSCRFIPQGLCQLGSTSLIGTDILDHAKVIALCGIARPQSFIDLLISLHAQVVGKHIFPDHYWWRLSDVDALKRNLVRTGAEFIVTTQKDAVRLNKDLCQTLPICVLELDTEWLGPIPVLSNFSPILNGQSKRNNSCCLERAVVSERSQVATPSKDCSKKNSSVSTENASGNI